MFNPGVLLMLLASSLLLLVKVEGQAHSNHRSPQGVYHVRVMEEKSVAHSACAAIQIAKDTVPFLNENQDSHILSVFTESGEEILVPRILSTEHETYGSYLGRAKSVPESILNR